MSGLARTHPVLLRGQAHEFIVVWVDVVWIVVGWLVTENSLDMPLAQVEASGEFFDDTRLSRSALLHQSCSRAHQVKLFAD